MAKLGPMTVEGNVAVMPHAVEQARARFADDHAGQDDRELAATIAADVRDAMGRGLVYDRRPRGFYVTGRDYHGNGGGRMRPGQRFVQHPGGQKGWVVSLASRLAGDIDVITTLRRLG